MVITLWQEGFTLSTNPDELRIYSEPRNAKFMAELKQGVVPSELRNSANTRGMSVSLNDRRHESFEKSRGPKKPTYFGGKGVSLSSGTSTNPQPQNISLNKDSKISKKINLIKF